jgi:hypothetical protein
VQHGHRVRPEPPAGKHIRQSPQTNRRQTHQTNTSNKTNQASTTTRLQHRNISLCNEHKEAQKPLQATKHLKETSKITSIISTSFSIKQQPHRIGSNDAACAMSTEWLEATAGKRPAISSQQAKSDKQQR